MFEQILRLMQNLPSEFLLCIEYFISLFAIIGATRFAGAAGLFTYISVAIFIANVQVLKISNFSILNFHAALGTVIFSSTFIASDILSEFYGPQTAKKAIWVSFGSNVFYTLIMLITISLKPVNSSEHVQDALKIIFMPQGSIFAASLISYLICQFIDVKIFFYIRNLTGGKYLGLRTFVSSAISGLIDNILFSLLAWVIFSPSPLSIHELIHTYILGTYFFRIIITFIQMPIIYTVKMFTQFRNINYSSGI